MSRRFEYRVRAAFILVGGILLLDAAAARPVAADTLTLGTGISQTWDRANTPAASPVMTLAMFNDTNNPNGIMLGFTLGMRLEPTAGATGTLTVGSATNPAVNPVFPTISTPQINPQPQAGFTSILMENSDAFTPVPVPQAGANAIAFTVTSSDAIGTFNIVLDGTQTRTAWNDAEEEFLFGNANNTLLTVGQITVVPEPSGMALAIGAILTGLAAARRRF